MSKSKLVIAVILLIAIASVLSLAYMTLNPRTVYLTETTTATTSFTAPSFVGTTIGTSAQPSQFSMTSTAPTESTQVSATTTGLYCYYIYQCSATTTWTTTNTLYTGVQVPVTNTQWTSTSITFSEYSGYETTTTVTETGVPSSIYTTISGYLEKNGNFIVEFPNSEGAEAISVTLYNLPSSYATYTGPLTLVGYWGPQPPIIFCNGPGEACPMVHDFYVVAVLP